MFCYTNEVFAEDLFVGNFTLNDEKIKDVVLAMISSKDANLHLFGSAIQYAEATDLFYKIVGSKKTMAHKGIMNFDGSGDKEWVIKQQQNDYGSTLSITTTDQSISQTLSLNNKKAKFIIKNPYSDSQKLYEFRVSKLPVIGSFLFDIKESNILRDELGND